MNRRDGMKSWPPCFLTSYSKAAPIALAVQLPRCPWSYTGGQSARRSTLLGSSASTASGAENSRSRASGMSGIHPYPLTVRVRSPSMRCSSPAGMAPPCPAVRGHRPNAGRQPTAPGTVWPVTFGTRAVPLGTAGSALAVDGPLGLVAAQAAGGLPAEVHGMLSPLFPARDRPAGTLVTGFTSDGGRWHAHHRAPARTGGGAARAAPGPPRLARLPRPRRPARVAHGQDPPGRGAGLRAGQAAAAGRPGAAAGAPDRPAGGADHRGGDGPERAGAGRQRGRRRAAGGAGLQGGRADLVE